MRLPTSPLPVAYGILLLLVPIALWQGHVADRPGKKLALISLRAELEALPREEIYRRAVALRGKLTNVQSQDGLFQGATLIWLVHSLTDDLTRPTVAEDAALPLAEGLEAVRRLRPDTGLEGGRLRTLYESRTKKEREQLPALAALIARSPTDDDVVRAYCSALRRGGTDERRKAVELARDYVRRSNAAPLAQLTLLLALSSSSSPVARGGGDGKGQSDRQEASRLAQSLLRATPKNSLAREQVESLAREFAAHR